MQATYSARGVTLAGLIQWDGYDCAKGISDALDVVTAERKAAAELGDKARYRYWGGVRDALYGLRDALDAE